MRTNPDTLAERKRLRNRAYYARNAERLKAQNRAHYAANSEQIRAQESVAYAANRLTRTAQKRGYQRANLQIARAYRKKRRLDPGFRLLENSRTRIRLALKGVCKSARSVSLIGCTAQQLRDHLEAKFRPGMTWENYGPVWHVDHIRPCARFDLLDPAQQRACFHYTNLQPLFAEENLRKGANESQ